MTVKLKHRIVRSGGGACNGRTGPGEAKPSRSSEYVVCFCECILYSKYTLKMKYYNILCSSATENTRYTEDITENLPRSPASRIFFVVYRCCFKTFVSVIFTL